MHSHTLPEKSRLLRAGTVVGSVVDRESLLLASSPEIRPSCEIVEFRADAFPGAGEALRDAMSRCVLPVLLTVRSPEEGGIVSMGHDERRQLYEDLLPLASLVDLEMASLEAMEPVVSAARARGIPVVASYHHFRATPEREVLESMARKAMEAGATAVKFATFLQGSPDLATLMALQETQAGPCATMGMGPLGRVSRLVLGQLGSVLNYGYLDRPTVPGQWAARRMRELLREVGETGDFPVPPA